MVNIGHDVIELALLYMVIKWLNMILSLKDIDMVCQIEREYWIWCAIWCVIECQKKSIWSSL
jgi:hypothetical protein